MYKEINGVIITHKKINSVYLLTFILAVFVIIEPNTIALGSERNEEKNDSFDTMNEKITRAADTWITSQLWADNEELNAIAVGDVDESVPGEEIVVAGESEKVRVIYTLGNTWSKWSKGNKDWVFKDDWRIDAIAIGDVYPKHPGNEIVVVGWSDWVTLIYKSIDKDEWITKRLYEDTDWLYDVEIGDIDPTHEGNEIVVVGDPQHVLILYYSEEKDSWENKLIKNASLIKGGYSVVAIGEFDSEHIGSEMIIAEPYVNDLGLIEIYYNWDNEGWNIRDIGNVDNTPLEMVIGDFYSKHPGNECALISIQRNVLMIYQNEDTKEWVMENIWRDSESIQDIVIYDILPENFGNELVLVGYSNSATILYEAPDEPSGWEARTIFTSNTNLIRVGIGEFDALHSGSEIAVVQSVGKLLKIQREVQRFNLHSPQYEISVPAGYQTTVPIIVASEGGFDSEVSMSIGNEYQLSQNGLETKFSKNVLIPPGLTELNIKVPKTTPTGEYKINITGTALNSGNIGDYIQLKLLVLSSTEPQFNITVNPIYNSVKVDFSINLDVSVYKINNWNDEIQLAIRYLPPGCEYSFKDSKMVPQKSTELTITTTSSTPMDRYFVIITGSSTENQSIRKNFIFVLDVRPQSPEFILVPPDDDLDLSINSTLKVIIQSFSIFGFDDEISLMVQDLPDFISAQVNPVSLVPPGNITVIFSAKPGVELKEYNISIIGTSKTMEINKTVFVNLIINPEVPWFNITVDPKKVEVKVNKVAVFNFEITPMAGFDDNMNVSIIGLESTMTWNSEQFPLKVSRPTTIQIEISGLDKAALHNLTITATDGTKTIDRDVQIDVFPKKKSDNGNDISSVYLQIAIIIIFLIFMIIIISKLTTHRKEADEGSKKQKKSKRNR